MTDTDLLILQKVPVNFTIRENKEDGPVPIELLALVPDSGGSEDLLVFALEHKRLVAQTKCASAYAIDDLIAKFPKSHSLRGAVLFNTFASTYHAIVDLVIQALVSGIKQRALAAPAGTCCQTPVKNYYPKVNKKPDDVAVAKPVYQSTERFYVDARDGRKRPTMALKDWRQRQGLCRGCGSNNHTRDSCDRANRIATYYDLS